MVPFAAVIHSVISVMSDMQIPSRDIEPAIALAETLARAYASRGGSVIELFAAFVGIVASEDRTIGLRCLTATDRYLSRTSSE